MIRPKNLRKYSRVYWKVSKGSEERKFLSIFCFTFGWLVLLSIAMEPKQLWPMILVRCSIVQKEFFETEKKN